ncbi:MAG: RagB/SusD family nutrient uptake outer membrane protein [Bacteroidetes bacterium]|nr:RagB/SusD family nutrient uptake outer membrane protein [Bacteroidota bacterium]MBS1539154.1 RagB/SusD family nutrient uptake outer membrane protein [Bacteroidota bacterium]
MKIKIKYSWVLSVITGLTLFGCADFLDRKPLQATLADSQQSVLEGQALGLYYIAFNYAGTNTLPWIDFNSIRGDDENKGSSLTDGAEVITEFETFQYTKDDWATDTYWNDHYYLANQASQLISIARASKATDEASKKNIGEAYFWRAYAYYELVKAYGEIPVFNYYYATTAGGIKAKSTVDQVYAQIDSDLDSAVQLLPVTWQTATSGYPGRVTVYTAHALWAKSFLFRPTPGWAKVIEHCNVVKNSGVYSLVPNFPDIWKDGVGGVGKNSSESILEFQAYIGSGGTNNYGVPWGTSQNIRQGGASVDWNLGWGWNVPSQTLVDAWNTLEPTDPRMACTILYSGQSDGGPATGGYGATLPPYSSTTPGASGFLDRPYWNKKVYSDPQMRQYTGEIGSSGGADWINHRVIRYADVLLMLAEASNETGDASTALTMLEMVRARARNSGTNPSALPPVTATDQATLRQAIKNERRWEFAMEGHRFHDLVRWGDATSFLAGLGYQPKNQYYPIPQPAINQSGGILIQNPNY